MKQTKTLAQVANDIENRENLNEYQNNETAIKCGTFESFADFLSYYRQHYRPILQAIENGETIDDNRRHLLNFLASDLLQMFADSDENSDEDEDSNTDTTDESKSAEFFTPGTRYRCIRTVIDDEGHEDFTAGQIYEQCTDPSIYYGRLRNNSGTLHAWPQPREIANECEACDMTPEDIDPRNYFEPVSE